MRKVLLMCPALLLAMRALGADIYIPGSALRPVFFQSNEYGQFGEQILPLSGDTLIGGPPLTNKMRFRGILMPYSAGSARGFEAQYKYTGWTRVKEAWVQLYRVTGGAGNRICVEATNYVVQHHYPIAFAASAGFNYSQTEADKYSAGVVTAKVPKINGIYTVFSVLDNYVQTLKLKDHADSGTLVDVNSIGGNPFGQGNLFCLNNAAFSPAKIELTGECRVDTDLTPTERNNLIADLKGADAIFQFVSYAPFCTNDVQSTLFASGVRLTVE